MSDRTYKWEHMEFTSKEIDLIVKLVHQWTGGSRTVNASYLTDNVKAWGLTAGFWAYECKHGVWDRFGWDCEECRTAYPKSRKWRLKFPQFSSQTHFEPRLYLPAEALWRIVRDEILEGREHVGYSVNKSRGWLALDIYPEGHRWDGRPTKSYLERCEIMGMLHSADYIHFQAAGDIWDIRVNEEGPRW
jgi:hypothetical protein